MKTKRPRAMDHSLIRSQKCPLNPLYKTDPGLLEDLQRDAEEQAALDVFGDTHLQLASKLNKGMADGDD
jgi:hypothetical protein